uniref:C3H1-type domain-containing protein n=1 Tax=Caenorhabditis tropicalis TaxID=1561998 RepID=A0A1I7UFZ2_9PELO
MQNHHWYASHVQRPVKTWAPRDFSDEGRFRLGSVTDPENMGFQQKLLESVSEETKRSWEQYRNEMRNKGSLRKRQLMMPQETVDKNWRTFPKKSVEEIDLEDEEPSSQPSQSQDDLQKRIDNAESALKETSVNKEVTDTQMPEEPVAIEENTSESSPQPIESNRGGSVKGIVSTDQSTSSDKHVETEKNVKIEEPKETEKTDNPQISPNEKNEETTKNIESDVKVSEVTKPSVPSTSASISQAGEPTTKLIDESANQESSHVIQIDNSQPSVVSEATSMDDCEKPGESDDPGISEDLNPRKESSETSECVLNKYGHCIAPSICPFAHCGVVQKKKRKLVVSPGRPRKLPDVQICPGYFNFQCWDHNCNFRHTVYPSDTI